MYLHCIPLDVSKEKTILFSFLFQDLWDWKSVGMMGIFTSRKMAALVSTIRYAFVRNSCLLRKTLPQIAVIGVQKNDIHTRLSKQPYLCTKSPFIQVRTTTKSIRVIHISLSVYLFKPVLIYASVVSSEFIKTIVKQIYICANQKF